MIEGMPWIQVTSVEIPDAGPHVEAASELYLGTHGRRGKIIVKNMVLRVPGAGFDLSVDVIGDGSIDALPYDANLSPHRAGGAIGADACPGSAERVRCCSCGLAAKEPFAIDSYIRGRRVNLSVRYAVTNVMRLIEDARLRSWAGLRGARGGGRS